MATLTVEQVKKENLKNDVLSELMEQGSSLPHELVEYVGECSVDEVQDALDKLIREDQIEERFGVYRIKE